MIGTWVAALSFFIVGALIAYFFIKMPSLFVSSKGATSFTSKKSNRTILAIGIFIVFSLISGLTLFRLYGTEAGRREIKDFKSNVGGGIERVVKVYDMEGDLIASYQGRFDVEYDSSRIVFDDEQGKRHIIYYSTGTVIIDEI